MVDHIVIDEAVRQSLHEKRPVVALESAVLTHGLPYPYNFQLAQEVEAILRNQGVTPATIALIDGKMHVGLSLSEIKHICTSENSRKINVRDIPYIVLNRETAGTTVSATMRIASMAGINILCTGGIGGVHQDFNQSLDASADLIELSMTKTIVVCSGAKIILDIPKTLEYLETVGVPILGYQTDQFPTFFAKSCDFPKIPRVDTVGEICAYLKIHNDLQLRNGVIIGNPCPPESAIDCSLILKYLEESMHQVRAENMEGKAVTPFLLDKIREKSKGGSLDANLALLRNNAKLSGEIALALHQDRSFAFVTEPIPNILSY